MSSCLVTDAGSAWNGASGYGLFISTGNTSSWNQLIIANNGMVTNVTTVSLADGLASSNNSLMVNGGKLYATCVAFSNSLVNTMQMDSTAEVVLTSFIMTNSNQRLYFNGGTLTIRGAVVSNTFPFVVGDGVNSATLVVPLSGTNIFMDGLVITNGATLAGSGQIAATSTVFGTLSPGVTTGTVGTLVNNGALTFKPAATIKIKLAAYTTPGAGWDLMVVTNGALTLGGTLKPVLMGGFLPTNTQSYMIMTNAGPLGMSGEFLNGGNSALIAAYSNDLIKVMGAFRLVLSNQCVVLNTFLPNSSLQRGTLFKFY